MEIGHQEYGTEHDPSYLMFRRRPSPPTLVVPSETPASPRRGFYFGGEGVVGRGAVFTSARRRQTPLSKYWPKRDERAPASVFQGFEPPRAEVPSNQPVAWNIVFRQSRDEAFIYFRTGF
jgi:hypothetical protein